MRQKRQKQPKSARPRIYFLDELRGFAILCMVVHHAFLDVGDVLQLSWGYRVFDALCTVQPIFWGLFILISGICSRLSRNPIRRGAVVLGCGLVITGVTVWVLPLMGITGAKIYFGILSCLGCCMILTGLLLPVMKKISPRLGMLVCGLLFFLTYGVSEPKHTMVFGLVHLPATLFRTNWLMPLGFFNSSFRSADYFALIPWFFLFLLGAFAWTYVRDGRLPAPFYRRHSRVLCWLGRNSLWVYMGHQVVLYAVFFLIAILMYT